MMRNLTRPVKRIMTVVMLYTCTLSLTGCWGSREISNMALVMATGIDLNKEDKIELSIQVFIPRAAGTQQQGAGPGMGGAESLVLVKTASGDNMADAMVNLQKLFTRQIFWGHCDAYIIGERLAKKGGLNEQIDFINRHLEPRTRADLFISQGPAADLLGLIPSLESYMGDVLRKLSELNFKKPVTVKDFQQMTITDSKGGILPVLTLSKPAQAEKATETIAKFAGLAIFHGDKMIGSVNEEVTQGLLWIRNQSKVSAITGTTPSGQKLSVHPLRQYTRLIPKIEHGKWSITVDLTVDGLLIQNGSRLDIMDPSSSKQAQLYLKRAVEETIHSSIKEVKYGMNTDAFGIAESFHKKYPKEWNQMKGHWPSFFPFVEVNVNAHIKLQDPGLMTQTLGLIKRGE